MLPSLAHQLAIEQTGPDEFAAKNPPVRMGNKAPIAYGGTAQGIAVNAACATVPATHKLYSLVGHFLGPTNLEAVLRCKVTRTRDTKSFATRRVEVTQVQKDGKARVVMETIADFHVVEPALLEYSARPTVPYSSVDASPAPADGRQLLVDAGIASSKQAQLSASSFEASEHFFDMRVPPESLSGQNMHGLVKGVESSQNKLHITNRTSGEWYRAKGALDSESDHLSNLAFLMDGGLAFLPLSHSHLWIGEAGPCSSLDFALRIFTPHVNLKEWHFKERVTAHAGYGRNYSEARIWDESGNMVASMTQQSIMRPQSKPKAAL
jgi:acyl-CoA thioesterase II